MSADYLASRFIEFLNLLKAPEAFLSIIGFYEPHRPYIASPQHRNDCFEGRSCQPNAAQNRNGKATNYLGSVNAMDEAIGRIYQALQEHPNKRYLDTIILFCSDNGPETINHGGAGNPGILRGWKRSLFEGGHRVPGFIHWPERIYRNERIQELASTLDIYATVHDVLRRHNPDLTFANADRTDGESLLPMIEQTVDWRRQKGFGVCYAMDFETQRPCQSFAYIKNNYKMIANRFPRGSGLRLVNLNEDRMERRMARSAQSDPDLWNPLIKEGYNWMLSVTSENQANCKGSVVES